MKTILKHIAFILLVVVFGACGNQNLKTVTTQATDNYNIVILSNTGSVKQGSGKFFLEFHSKNDQLVDVGKVEVNASMPMPGMPMVNDAEVKVADKPGRYEVKYNLGMSGTWTLNIKFGENKFSTISLSVS